MTSKVSSGSVKPNPAARGHESSADLPYSGSSTFSKATGIIDFGIIESDITDSESPDTQSGRSVAFGKLLLKTAVLLIASAVVSVGTTADAADPADEFAQLEQQFQRAKTKAEFTAVATGYEALKQPNSKSVSVLFNQANAWFEAEEFGRAIVGYRQALRLAPNDPDIRNNLKLAVNKAGHELSQSTAIDYAFFWNRYFTTSALAICITLMMLIAAALFLLNRKSQISTVAFRSLVGLTFVLIASFAVKINDEERTIHGAVVVDSSDAKKGPAASYESAFSSPLMDGREFVVVNQQAAWVQVQISGIGSGWVPESDVLVY